MAPGKSVNVRSTIGEEKAPISLLGVHHQTNRSVVDTSEETDIFVRKRDGSKEPLQQEKVIPSTPSLDVFGLAFFMYLYH